MTAITTSKPQPDTADGLPANDNNADLACDDFSISMLIPDELNTDEICRRAERLANALQKNQVILLISDSISHS